MERNELTTVQKLTLGDRFYKVSDKNKIVFQMVPHEVKKTHFQTYKYFCCEASVIDNKNNKHKERNFKAINKETPVVFLRHKD